MASVDTQNNPNDPNNPNNPAGNPNQVQTQGPNQPATSGGAGAVTSTGAANVTGQVVGTNNPSQPFQNVASYLAANAPQSQSLAGQVADSVSKPIQQAQGDIANASQNFMNSVNAGYTPENKDLVSSVASNPVTAAADPNTVSAFQQQLNDAYSGPTDFTASPAYANLGSEVANAQSLGSNAQTPAGIQSLLQGIEGPTTAGVNNLDTLLLAENPSNFQTIQNAGTAANQTNNNLGNFLTNTTTTNNAAQRAAAANASAAANNAKTTFTGAGGVVPTLQNTLNKQLQTQTTAANKYNDEIQGILTALNTGKALTPDQDALIDPGGALATLNPYGSSAGVFPSLLNLGLANISPNQLAQFYTGPGLLPQPTIANTETKDQATTAAALNKLLNTTISGAPTATSEPFSIPDKVAGSFDDKGALQNLYKILTSYSSPYLAGLAPGQANAYLDDTQFIASLLGIPSTGRPNPTPLQPSPPTPTGLPFLGPPGGDVHAA